MFLNKQRDIEADLCKNFLHKLEQKSFWGTVDHARKLGTVEQVWDIRNSDTHTPEMVGTSLIPARVLSRKMCLCATLPKSAIAQKQSSP